MPYYFAYGSNMSSARLRRRVGELRVHGPALLRDWAHRFDKRGDDGSAKGNVVPSAGAVVYGVLYELERGQLERLDHFEGGYRRIEIWARLVADERAFPAITYSALAEERAPDLVPAPEYLRHYQIGAEEHGLPRAYLDTLLRGLR